MMEHVYRVDKIEAGIRRRNLECRSGAHERRITEIVSGKRNLSRRGIDAGHLESHLAHPPHIPALSAANVESAALSGDESGRRQGVAHHGRLADEKGLPASLGDLHVVGIGEAVEVVRLIAASGTQMNEQ